jgi:hypothetical protein
MMVAHGRDLPDSVNRGRSHRRPYLAREYLAESRRVHEDAVYAILARGVWVGFGGLFRHTSESREMLPKTPQGRGPDTAGLERGRLSMERERLRLERQTPTLDEQSGQRGLPLSRGANPPTAAPGRLPLVNSTPHACV